MTGENQAGGGWTFAKLHRDVIHNPALADGAVRLYAALLLYADQDSGVAWPSQETLASNLGWSVSTVRRQAKRLAAAGMVMVLTTTTATGRRNLYTLSVLVPRKDAEAGNTQPVNSARTPERDGAESHAGDRPELTAPMRADLTEEQNHSTEPVEQGKKESSGVKRRNKPGRPVPHFSPDSPAYELALYLRGRILAFNPRTAVPKADPTDRRMQDWAAELDRLHRLGPPGGNGQGYQWEEVRCIIDWVFTESDFWPSNIQSPAKLRGQIVMLEGQMKQGRRPARANNRAEEEPKWKH